MSELDRSRAFDRVWGIVGEGEPYFFQDGKAFNSDGLEIVSDETIAEVETDATEPKKKGRKKAAPDEASEVATDVTADVTADLTGENHDLL
jgi:hypothetical protein